MHNHSQLSRADLLACLRKHGETQLDAFAAALGYEPAPVAQPSPRRKRVQAQGRSDAVATASATPGAVPKARFYRVVERRQLAPDEVVREEPEWFRLAVPYLEEIRAAAEVSPPPQPPLMRWSRLWPFLKTVLGAQLATPALDMPRIVRRLARGQPLQRLPRTSRRGWAPVCQIIIDYADALLPFWADCNEVQQRLRLLRGMQGLELIAFPDGDPGGRCWRYGQQAWQDIGRYRVPPPGTPVLVLSDLGCIDTTWIPWLRPGPCPTCGSSARMSRSSLRKGLSWRA